MLLTRAASAETDLLSETASRLLELAAADQAAFRAVVARMSKAQRGFMEGVLREGGAGARGAKGEEERDEEGGEPAIALKLSFGAGGE